MTTTDALPSWRDGATKRAIISFVTAVTTPGPTFVPAVERVATFDNDGTLWCEKPLYVQADFILRRWTAMLAADPSLAERQPYRALAEGDRAWLAALLDHIPDLLRGLGEAFGGISPDAFESEVRTFFTDVRHPTLDRPYTETAYRPMVELIRWLEAHDFRVFICTGGGRDFVRVISEPVYGIDRERVIGSAGTMDFRDGRLVRGTEVEMPIDDGPGKPVHIWSRVGRLPLFAGGNSDGDIEMLSTAGFALLVHHDDAAREFAYDTGAERALESATAGRWTVASMRDDFVTVF